MKSNNVIKVDLNKIEDISCGDYDNLKQLLEYMYMEYREDFNDHIIQFIINEIKLKGNVKKD